MKLLINREKLVHLANLNACLTKAINRLDLANMIARSNNHLCITVRQNLKDFLIKKIEIQDLEVMI